MKLRALLPFAVLALILGGGVFVFYSVRPNTSMQLITGIATAVAYVIWGIVHHLNRHDLHQKIVIEYMLIGIIAIVLLVTLLGF